MTTTRRFREPFIASLQTGAGALNGVPVVHLGSMFIAQCRSMNMAERIARLLNVEEGRP